MDVQDIVKLMRERFLFMSIRVIRGAHLCLSVFIRVLTYSSVLNLSSFLFLPHGQTVFHSLLFILYFSFR